MDQDILSGKFPATAALICVGLLLAGCARQELGQRRIELAGTGPAAGAAIQNFQTLLDATKSSYVTLGVFDRMARETQEAGAPEEIATNGSGFVIDAKKGLIMTAAHVAITPGWRIKARGPDRRIYEGRVLETLPSVDTAIVRISSSQGLTTARIAPSACIRRGARVFSLGKPSKQGDIARFGTLASMSFGRPVKYQGYGYPDAMVVRMKTEKGESGGPLFDDQGRLIGMIVATVTDSNGRKLGLAHALPLPVLASAVCSITTCSAAWRAHLGRSVRNCPSN